MERLIELTKRHKILMDEKNVLISVYTNASGWSIGFVFALAPNERVFARGWKLKYF